VAGTSILDGNRYGFLTSIHTRMLWYRKDLIPEPPETWDELVVIAQGLTDIDRNFWGYTWYAGRHFNAVELTYCNPIWEQGGKISSEDGRAAWDNEYVANTVQMHRDFLYKYRISPTSVLAGGVTSSGGDIWTMFVGNQSAMMINGAWILGDASDGAGKPLWDAGKIGVAPIPSFPGKKPQHFANGWAIGIPTGAKHPDQAWEFIKYFESPGPQLKHSLVEGGMPTRMSAWDDPALSDPTRQFFLENIKEYGRPMDPLVFYDEALNSLAITFQELLLEPQQDIISTLEKSANEFNNKYY
jgi:multiple sugar transport system substrate-binding protein